MYKESARSLYKRTTDGVGRMAHLVWSEMVGVM